MDKKKKDGTIFRDRAFSNVYVCEIKENIQNLQFDIEEVDGLVKLKAKEVYELLKKKQGTILGVKIIQMDGEITEKRVTITSSDFLVNEGETAIGKYKEVLKKVIQITNKEDSDNSV